jgi:hypothetical protein
MTDSPRSADPPPGWYADSPSATRLRWWNGTAWTDHYQGATAATPTLIGEEAPAPMTRAERRAATASAPPPPVVWAEQTAFATAPRTDAVTAAPASDSPVAPEKFPDQIVDRGPRSVDRPPAPVVHRPPASTTTHAPTTRSTFIPLPQPNGPAAASLVLALLSVLSAAAVFFWLRTLDPVLADVISLLTLAVLGVAFLLALVGVVLAWRRPTRKAAPILALAVSVLLIGAVAVLFSLRVISIALPLPA